MRSFALITCAALTVVLSSNVAAQRVRFPAPNSAPPGLVPVNPNLGSGPAFAPPGAMLGGAIQPFDPYALPGSLPSGIAMPPPSWPVAPLSPQPLSPSFGMAPGGAQLPPSLPPLSGAPYGQPIPGGLPNANTPFTPPSNQPYGYPLGQTTSGPPYQRLFQDTGLRGTYLYGSEKDDLGITEIEASTTAYLANFLGIPNGLRVTPGFAFLWTDGPAAPETSDVPPRLYGGYLDVGLEPQLGPRFGMEMTARVGVYSDFETFTTDSLRLLGTVVGAYRISDRTSLKLGVAYIDRVKVKVLPAGGILWEPNSQTRWDIFFPAPKISNYWTTVGNKQVWWYFGGEYGGGSWTIEREEEPLAGASERIDINDIRIYAGLEWWNLNRYNAFAEIGYVFSREIIYFLVPSDSIQVDDTFMVRAGISW